MYHLNHFYQQLLPFDLIVQLESQQHTLPDLLRLQVYLLRLENLLLPFLYASIIINCGSFNILLIWLSACCAVTPSTIRWSKLSDNAKTGATTTSPSRAIGLSAILPIPKIAASG